VARDGAPGVGAAVPSEYPNPRRITGKRRSKLARDMAAALSQYSSNLSLISEDFGDEGGA
jgi:hypothetical protein